MKGKSALVTVLIIIISGAFAGLIHGSVNMVIVNPYLESAIEFENQSLFETGITKDTPEFRVQYESYREWQRGGHILAAVVLGSAMGSLFGLVFVTSHRSIPGSGYITKSVVLAGVMYCALYVVPFVKYPPNPPAVGDPDTIAIRTALYVTLFAVSGLGALASAKIALYVARRRMTGPRTAACLGVACYVLIAAAACIALPPNPDPAPVIDGELLDGFRAASALGMASFWASVGVILGLLWRAKMQRDSPHENLNSDSIY